MSLPVHAVDSLAGVHEGAVVEVTGDEAHHAVAVRRLRVGEAVVLTDGRGTSATGSVASTGKRVFTVEVGSVSVSPPAQPALVVVQAIPKGERGDLAVEVLTEIGVAEIVPWAAARSVAIWKGERAAKPLARWRATVREAAKQSRRAWFPVVTDPCTTEQVADQLRTADLAVVLHEAASDTLAGLTVPSAGRVVVVVGPEGGLTPEELSTFTGAGAALVRLGPEVLRTSTAGVAAAAALLARTPRWQ